MRFYDIQGFGEPPMHSSAVVSRTTAIAEVVFDRPSRSRPINPVAVLLLANRTCRQVLDATSRQKRTAWKRIVSVPLTLGPGARTPTGPHAESSGCLHRSSSSWVLREDAVSRQDNRCKI